MCEGVEAEQGARAQQTREARAGSLGKGWAGREDEGLLGQERRQATDFGQMSARLLTESPDPLCTRMFPQHRTPWEERLENHLSPDLYTPSLEHTHSHAAPGTRTLPPQTSQHPMTTGTTQPPA